MTSLNANNLKVHDEREDTSKVVKNAVRCSICFANADLKGNMYFLSRQSSAHCAGY